MRKIFDKIGLFIQNLVRSLDNVQNSGYSARKLLAISCFWTAYKLADKLEGENRLYAVYAFLIVALLALGIVTVEQIIKFKTQANANPATDTEKK